MAQRTEGGGGNVGDPVMHPRFGRGIIRQLQGEGADLRAVVDFEAIGSKTLLLSYAKMRHA